MRRTRHEIGRDILNIALVEAKHTQIVYKANLNFRIIKRHLERLIELKLLEIHRNGNKRTYLTTRRGIQYLNQLNMLLG